MKTKQKTRLQKMKYRLLMQMLLFLFSYTFIGFFLYFAAVNLSHMWIWQGNEWIYRIIHWLDLRREVIAFFYIIAGYIAIFLYFWSRPFRYLQEVTDATANLYRKGEELIELSEPLSEVENKLNQTKMDMLNKERIAKEAEQRKNDLVTYLAHDLKTPITSIIGYLTLLRDEPQISPELRAKYTGIALDKAERLEDLINEFFDITRFNLSHQSLEMERVHLSRMLEQISYEFYPILAEKNLQIQTDLAPNVEILCDPDKMERVFDNLIRNAVSYSYPDTEIFLTLRKAENWVQICILNHGKTIPPDKLARIFEQFFRLDSARSSSTGGAGLGLAISKEIVELHGGSITAESANESIRFTLLLPASV